MAFANVLVGIDGSARSREAIELAQWLQAREDARVLLVHVHQFGVVPEAVYEAVGTPPPGVAGQRMLERWATLIDAPVELLEVEDSLPARALHDLALREAADLLAVGPSHRGRAGRLLLGDVGHQLAGGAPCPVAVPPLGWRPPPQWSAVGIADAGSSASRSARDCATTLAAAVGAELRTIELANGSGGTEAVIAASAGLDLLVVGTSQLLHRVRCPLLVVPPSAERG